MERNVVDFDSRRHEPLLGNLAFQKDRLASNLVPGNFSNMMCTRVVAQTVPGAFSNIAFCLQPMARALCLGLGFWLASGTSANCHAEGCKCAGMISDFPAPRD